MSLIKSALKGLVMPLLFRFRYPTCIVHYGAIVGAGSKLGRFNVIFKDAIIIESTLGDHTYVQQRTTVSNADIGKFGSIAAGVTIGLSQHAMQGVSTHPSFYLKNTPLAKTYSDRDCFVTTQRTLVGHDVWIGQNAVIMSGVKLGTGCVIAACAVVTRDVPDYAVVAGVPAKIIKYRFDESLRRALLESQWWCMPEPWLEENHALFSEPERLLEALERHRNDSRFADQEICA